LRARRRAFHRRPFIDGRAIDAADRHVETGSRQTSSRQTGAANAGDREAGNLQARYGEAGTQEACFQGCGQTSGAAT